MVIIKLIKRNLLAAAFYEGFTFTLKINSSQKAEKGREVNYFVYQLLRIRLDFVRCSLIWVVNC